MGYAGISEMTGQACHEFKLTFKISSFFLEGLPKMMGSCGGEFRELFKSQPVGG